MSAGNRATNTVLNFAISVAGLLILAACPSVCFANSPGAHVSSNRPEAQAKFSRKAGSGYSILFELDRGKASLTVQGDEGRVSYSGRGSLKDGRIKFGLGRLGRIDIRFKPEGPIDRVRPPKSCKGRPQVVRNGIFFGSIKFRGENDYTHLSAHRAHGTMAPPRSWKCPNSPRKRPESIADPPAALGAFTPHNQVAFIALGASDLSPLRFFVVSTSEREGAVRIRRSVLTEGKPASFSASKDLSAATISPPEPFTGTASFKRNADGSTEWFGTLGVALPGVESVALVGPEFNVKLGKPRTEQEFLELLGPS